MTTPTIDPHVCAQCASQGPTCCQISSGQEELCFPLSEAEINVMRDFTKEQGWFVQEANSEAFLVHVAGLFPKEEELVRKVFHPRKHHFRLAAGPDGKCMFLGESGCVLPREARPYYCRLFPIWISGEQLVAMAGPCLAVRNAWAMGKLLDSLGTTAKKVRELHAKLRLCWGLPPARGMENVTLRLK